MTITLNGTTGITDVNGTAAAPAITGTDTDSGMYFGTNSVGLATNGTNAVYVDASQNVGIGTTSPLGLFNIKGSNGQLVLNNGASSGGMRLSAFTNAGTANGFLAFEGFSAEYGRFDSTGGLRVGLTTNIFNTASEEKFSVKNTSLGAAATFESTNVTGGYPVIYVRSTDATAGQTAVFFYRTSTIVGSISTTASTTAYNTSSDYRLKNTIAPMTGALAKVALLKPCTYKWKIDGSSSQGFIAHELAEVVPDCVTGEKDAVDSDGNIKPQGIDTSFLIATLTAAIQEQQALITSLTDRIAALEAR